MKSRLTSQKRIVLEVVQSACYHPTAEQIFGLAQKRLPKISRGTVYRNLDFLTQSGQIKKIDIPGEPARFDADLNHKAYFVCREKEALYDLEVDKNTLSKIFKNHPAVERIEDFSLVVFGVARESEDEKKLRKGKITI